MNKEKYINRIVNIIYYTFNFITMPVLYTFIFIHFKIYEYNFYENDKFNNVFYFTLIIPLTIITWRIQWLIAEFYTSDEKWFGLDFFKYKKRLRKIKNLKPKYNKKIEDNELDVLFEKYCKDNTIQKIHQNSFVRDFRGGDIKKYTQIDINLFSDYHSKIHSGVEIILEEEPPLNLVIIRNMFRVQIPKYFGNEFESEFNRRLKLYPECNYQVVEENESLYVCKKAYCFEYAVIMGTVIKFISSERYDELFLLHKKSENLYDKYILNKRLNK